MMAMRTRSKYTHHNWTNLGSDDLLELIFHCLPIRALVRAATVCKQWRSVIVTKSFMARYVVTTKKPWLFFFFIADTGERRRHKVLALDPESDEWMCLSSSALFRADNPFFYAASGFFFCIDQAENNASKIAYSPILKPKWCTAAKPLFRSRVEPLLHVFHDESGVPNFIVLGGDKPGNNNGDFACTVEIYNPNTRARKFCGELPALFRNEKFGMHSCSAFYKGRIYLFAKYSRFIASFDVQTHLWSSSTRIVYLDFYAKCAFLISCKDRLVLAGLYATDVVTSSFDSFRLWEIIDETTMRTREISTMPRDLFHALMMSSGGDSETGINDINLKCVGTDNVICVYSDFFNMSTPRIVCEMENQSGKCNWRMLPEIPSRVFRGAQKVTGAVGYLSTVPLDDVFSKL